MKHPISTLPYEMNSVIEAGTDLNDYRSAGIYFFSYANRPSNLPPDGYGNGWCLVLPSSINAENYCTQIWISFGNNATTDARNKPMARRTYFNGTWTDWWKLPCTGEYTSPTDVTDAITTALADYIPRNTTEVTATTEAEFEQTLEALPQTPPKIYFFHVLQGTSTRIGLPSGRYGIEVYVMGSTLRTVIAYSYNNNQKTYKKIRTSGASGSWSSWLDITNTDTVTNLGTTVTNLETQVAAIEPVYFLIYSQGMNLIFNTDEAPTFDLEPSTVSLLINHGQVSLSINFKTTAGISAGTDCSFPSLKILKPIGGPIPSKGTKGISPITSYDWDGCIYGSALYFKALKSINSLTTSKIVFNYFSKDALDIDNIRSILGEYEQPIPS